MIFFLSTMKMKTRPWIYKYYYIEIPRLKNCDIFLELEKIKLQHHYPKAFFRTTKSHDNRIWKLKNNDIEIPMLKSHGIKFLPSSDPYAPLWFLYPQSSYLYASTKASTFTDCRRKFLRQADVASFLKIDSIAASKWVTWKSNLPV